jgi:VanZ family protein
MGSGLVILAALLVFVFIALGVLLEFGQNYSAGRFFATGDMIANAIGVCAGLAAGLPLRSAVS